jgi:glycosyltransferase involved in cell wall biosynthesis
MALTIMPFFNSFAPGGVERSALRLCSEWQKDPDLDIRLVVARPQGPLSAHLPPGLKFETGDGAGLARLLIAAIRRHRPDILFAAGNTYAAPALAAKLVLGRQCPPIVLKISNDLARPDMAPPLRLGYRQWLRLQGRLVDHATGLAEPMRAEIRDALHLPDSRITIIPDAALDAADLARLGTTERTPASHRRYVAIGRLVPQKNFPLLLHAFAQARRPGDTLAIIGEGSERPRLEALAAHLDLGDAVSLPGHGDVATALAAADVFVLSSDYEALPAVVVEALASGMPVVATDCCVSMPALIGRFGALVPRRDTAALAAAMAAQPPLLPADRTAAALTMAAFTAERAAPAYAALFHSLARRMS